MAAILRASVKRAIAGCMPFGQQAFIELTEGAVDGAGRRRRTLEQVFQIVIVVAVESADEHRAPVVRPRSGNRRCYASPRPARSRPRTDVCCGSGAAFVPARSITPRESHPAEVRCAAASPQHACGSPAPALRSADSEIYDWHSRLWTLTSPMNQARAAPVSLRLKDGRVMVIGGFGDRSVRRVGANG